MIENARIYYALKKIKNCFYKTEFITQIYICKAQSLGRILRQNCFFLFFLIRSIESCKTKKKFRSCEKFRPMEIRHKQKLNRFLMSSSRKPIRQKKKSFDAIKIAWQKTDLSELWYCILSWRLPYPVRQAKRPGKMEAVIPHLVENNGSSGTFLA